ncbi:hypothetical protein JCM10449v2_006658 [Rhodotorula kratochvilovae]
MPKLAEAAQTPPSQATRDKQRGGVESDDTSLPASSAQEPQAEDNWSWREERGDGLVTWPQFGMYRGKVASISPQHQAWIDKVLDPKRPLSWLGENAVPPVLFDILRDSGHRSLAMGASDLCAVEEHLVKSGKVTPGQLKQAWTATGVRLVPLTPGCVPVIASSAHDVKIRLKRISSHNSSMGRKIAPPTAVAAKSPAPRAAPVEGPDASAASPIEPTAVVHQAQAVPQTPLDESRAARASSADGGSEPSVELSALLARELADAKRGAAERTEKGTPRPVPEQLVRWQSVVESCEVFTRRHQRSSECPPAIKATLPLTPAKLFAGIRIHEFFGAVLRTRRADGTRDLYLDCKLLTRAMRQLKVKCGFTIGQPAALRFPRAQVTVPAVFENVTSLYLESFDDIQRAAHALKKAKARQHALALKAASPSAPFATPEPEHEAPSEAGADESPMARLQRYWAASDATRADADAAPLPGAAAGPPPSMDAVDAGELSRVLGRKRLAAAADSLPTPAPSVEATPEPPAKKPRIEEQSAKKVRADAADAALPAKKEKAVSPLASASPTPAPASASLTPAPASASLTPAPPAPPAPPAKHALPPSPPSPPSAATRPPPRAESVAPPFFDGDTKRAFQDLVAEAKELGLKHFELETLRLTYAHAQRHGGAAFVALDVEFWERAQNFLLEFGWSSLVFSANKKTGKVEARRDDQHVVVKENSSKRNGRFAPDARDHFDFGRTLHLPQRAIYHTLAALLDSLSAHQHVFLIFHDPRGDLRSLGQIGFDEKRDFHADLRGLGAPPQDGEKAAEGKVWVVDTQRLFSAWINRKAQIGLEKACIEVKVPTKRLHNAGNDAHYTLDLFERLMNRRRVPAPGSPLVLEVDARLKAAEERKAKQAKEKALRLAEKQEQKSLSHS